VQIHLLPAGPLPEPRAAAAAIAVTPVMCAGMTLTARPVPQDACR
jgi:hypothetical protein